jgi:hypothetical protein
MRDTDAQKFSNISASTSPFILFGGRYAVNVVATFGGGSVSIQQLGPDGSTYLDLFAAYDASGAEQDETINVFKANGMKVFDLPPGQYRIAISTATAVYVNVVRVPLE